MNIEERYSQLLGIHSPWPICRAYLRMGEPRVEIEIEYAFDEDLFPECDAMRSWHHLDTTKFSTHLLCELPRVSYKERGVKTANAPWAGKNSRFTQFFESFEVRVLSTARSSKRACKPPRMNCHQVATFKAYAFKRGLSRKEAVTIFHLCIDEKQFHGDHRYISNLLDFQGNRMLNWLKSARRNPARL